MTVALMMGIIGTAAPKSTAANDLNVRVAKLTTTSATIVWDGTGTFRVTCPSLNLDDNNVNGTEYKLNGLIQGTIYNVYVYPAGSYSFSSISIKPVPSKPSKTQFTGYYTSTGMASASCYMPSGVFPDGYQFKFYTYKGKCKKTITTTSSGVSNVKLKKGSFYKVRARAFVYINNGKKKKYGKWSGYDYIGIQKKASTYTHYYSKTKTITLKWKKIKGVAKYKVYTCTTHVNPNRKKVKTLGKNATKITVKKHGKKYIKRGQLVYVDVVPYTKEGKKLKKSAVFFYGF